MNRLVVVVFGLPGSGKSYFAERLARVLGASYISSDRIRSTYFNVKDYSLEGKEKVYKKMTELATEELEKGNNVVLDGTFHLERWRSNVAKDFENTASCHFVEIQAPESLIKERTNKKRRFSDADFKIYKQLRQVFEPMCQPHLCMMSTHNNIGEMVKTSLNYLQLKEEKYGSEGD